MAKTTRATFKSFIAKNKGNLFIDCRSSFNGMIDGLSWDKDHGFKPAGTTENHNSNTLGIRGVWLVGNSRDYYTAYDDGTYSGIEVSNACGHFTVATRKD